MMGNIKLIELGSHINDSACMSRYINFKSNLNRLLIATCRHATLMSAMKLDTQSSIHAALHFADNLYDCEGNKKPSLLKWNINWNVSHKCAGAESQSIKKSVKPKCYCFGCMVHYDGDAASNAQPYTRKLCQAAHKSEMLVDFPDAMGSCSVIAYYILVLANYNVP